MSNKHKWYDVIVAWASGEKIQERSVDDFGKTLFDWQDFNPSYTPNFMSKNIQWRIKPNTVTKKYRMALVADEYNGKGVMALDLSHYSLDFPAEREVDGFISWVGDTVEVEIEV